MALRPLRILLIGGDPAMWISLATMLENRSTQLVLPESIDAESLDAAAKSVDAIVVVTNPAHDDPSIPLRMLRKAGLQRGTVVIADHDDHKTAGEALAMGFGGYVVRGSDASRLATAVTEVAEGGIVYAYPAAQVLQESLQAPVPDPANVRNAARALASALELKDTYTGGHADRVTGLAMRLAARAELVDEASGEALEAAFLLHDVGKIGIPETILGKPGPLTEPERRVLQTHPILGERVIAPLGFPSVVRDVIRFHHERWDGAGYPDGLAEDEIPPAARVFAIADALDAMTSIRPYQEPRSYEAAVTEILAHAGTQFDPELCLMVEEVFLKEPEVYKVLR